jgi:hypothetical protein
MMMMMLMMMMIILTSFTLVRNLHEDGESKWKDRLKSLAQSDMLGGLGLPSIVLKANGKPCLLRGYYQARAHKGGHGVS